MAFSSQGTPWESQYQPKHEKLCKCVVKLFLPNLPCPEPGGCSTGLHRSWPRGCLEGFWGRIPAPLTPQDHQGGLHTSHPGRVLGVLCQSDLLKSHLSIWGHRVASILFTLFRGARTISILRYGRAGVSLASCSP